MILKSNFSDGGKIPKEYTCDGENVSPYLEISEVPENASSLVLIADDPDAPGGTFNHWILWNIPVSVKKFEKGRIPEGVFQGINDFGKNLYGGPCPPSGKHRYFFKLYALDEVLNIPANSKRKDVEDAMEGHVIEKAMLTGVYKK
jgi:hypothetical protein